MTPPVCDHAATEATDHTVCHCLGVTASQIQDAVETQQLDSVRDICAATGAGTGCMACRMRLGRFLGACGRAGR